MVSSVLSESLRLAAFGVAGGLIGARLCGPLIAGLLYGVAPTDAVAQIAAVAFVTAHMLIPALLGGWLARRYHIRIMIERRERDASSG